MYVRMCDVCVIYMQHMNQLRNMKWEERKKEYEKKQKSKNQKNRNKKKKEEREKERGAGKGRTICFRYYQ